jgi:hypothetical protein
LYTDSELALTRGNPAGPLGLLAYLDPTRDNFTAVTAPKNGQAALMGQMLHTPGHRSAHISYLLPADELDQPSLPELIEILAVQAGTWGASSLLAEVEEASPALDPVRNSGFSVYGWQTIWSLPAQSGTRTSGPWQIAAPTDDTHTRTLYQQLVPLLVQAAEPYAPGKGPRLVYRHRGEILAYAEASVGPQGVYVNPVIHPAVRDVQPLLAGLSAQISQAVGRPLYLVVRSYHAWLENTLHQMRALPAPRQALLVKHMAVLQRVPLLERKTVREAYKPEASVPLIQHSTIHKN